MKHLLSIIILAVVLTGCSAQKRAERHVRRAVALCPELVQMTARPIDTVLTAPGFADMAVVPFSKVLAGDTVYAATNHGTVVVSLRQSDSALRVGFVAAPQKIHFTDTFRYAQIVSKDPSEQQKRGFWRGFAWCFLGICLGIAPCVWFIRKIIIDMYSTKKRQHHA